MKFFLAALGVTFLTFISCAPMALRDEPIETLQAPKFLKKGSVQSSDWKLFFQAEQAFAAKNYEAAAQSYRAAKNENATGRVHLISAYRLGSIYYTQGQFRKASGEFNEILEKFPNSDLDFDVRYNLAASEFQLANYEAAYAALAELQPSRIEAQGPARASMVYRLTALSAVGIKNYSAAVAAYSAQMQLPIGLSQRETIQGQIDALLPRIQTRLELEKLLAGVNEPATRARIQERLQAVQTELSEAQSASGMGQVSAQAFDSGSSSSKPIQNHIGVVLPLTGKWASFGNRALDAILLATKSLQEESKIPFRVYIKDTRSNPIAAAHAVDALVNQNHVFAIIGPINWDESLAVAERSQKLGVPNILLTLKEGLSIRGSHLFQTGLTPRIQLESLVKHCMDDLQYKRFAILGPNDSYGKDMIHQFWDLVERNGGSVVAYQTYTPQETDFQEYIRSMVGLDKPNLRKKEWQAAERFIAEETKKRNGRKISASLPPIIDFDAIFIPDSAKALGQIAPSLAYFDVTGAPLLGTTEWQSAQLFQRAGRHVVGAMFPGGINPATENQRQRKFLTDYQEAYQAAPDVLAAQAYEAMEILGSAIPRTGSVDRDQLAREISQMRNFQTALGKISFDETRVAQRELPIFTIERNGQIREN